MPYHDYDSQYSTAEFHSTILVCPDLTEHTSVLTRPMLDDDGEPCIGLYDPNNRKLIGRYTLISYSDEGEDYWQPRFQPDTKACFRAFRNLNMGFRRQVPFTAFLNALQYPGIMYWFGDHDADITLNPETWKEVLMSNMPSVESMQSSSAFGQDTKTKDLRAIVNALGLKPKSIKREDCYQAILEARTEFEAEEAVLVLEDPEDSCYSQFMGVLLGKKTCSNIPCFFTRNHHDDPALFTRQEIISGGNNYNPLEILVNYTQHALWAEKAEAELDVEGERSVTTLVGAGVDLDAAQQTLALRSENCWFANQQTSVLRDEVAALLSQMEDSERKRLELLATIQAAKPVVVPSGQGDVEVMGRKFPHYASPDAPAAIPNYSLEYWRASMRVGPRADVAEFNAADFGDAVLNETVVGLVGAPGTGKTTICEQIAHVLGIPCFIVQFTRDKPIEQLIGVDKIRSGSQVFVDGEITVALRAAAANPDVPCLVVFDEFDHAPSEVQSDFHGVVEGRDYTLPNGEVIKNHGNLRFVLTRNTTGHGDQNGRHASANISDSAFNSRIKAAFSVDYMKPIHEQVLLTVHGLEMPEAEQVVAFANATRQSVKSLDSGESFDGMSEPVCLRHMIGYAKARSRGVAKAKALAMSIIAHLPEADRSVANEMIVSHIRMD